MDLEPSQMLYLPAGCVGIGLQAVTRLISVVQPTKNLLPCWTSRRYLMAAAAVLQMVSRGDIIQRRARQCSSGFQLLALSS